MGLLLHLPPANLGDIPLARTFPRIWPFTQMVNRVKIGEIDPFHYTLACEPISDILQLPQNRKTFEEMLESRSDDLRQLNQPIYMMFSGGLDSSCALIAIMRTWSETDLKRVHIVASHMTSVEFPELWGQVAKLFKGRIHNAFHHVERFCERGIVVTGEHGDQILGSDLIKVVHSLFGDAGIHTEWQQTLPEVFKMIFRSDEIVPEFIERYEETLNACPFPIRTSFDWVWWFNFTNKWQSVKFRILKMKPWKDQKKNFKKIRHFYDTPDWQRWSFDNHDLKIHKTLESYKMPEKEYIVKCTGHDHYYSKPKVGSLSGLWANSGFNEAIDEDLNFLTRQEAIGYIRR